MQAVTDTAERWFDLERVDTTGTLTTTVEDYTPLVLDTGHVAATRGRTASLRRDDGLGILDVRQDDATGALVSVTLVLYAAAVSSVRLDIDDVREIGSGLPVFAAGTADAGRGAVSGSPIARPERPLQLHRSDCRVELAWSSRRIDGLVRCEGVRFCFAGAEWVGLSLDGMGAEALEAFDRAL